MHIALRKSAFFVSIILIIKIIINQTQPKGDFMKKLGLLALMSLSLNTFAGSTGSNPVVTCTTIGDALDTVELIGDTKGNITEIKVNAMDPDESATYKTMENLYSVSKDGIRIVAAASEYSTSGGAIYNAMILDLASDYSTGMLAEAGDVYFLKCQKN